MLEVWLPLKERFQFKGVEEGNKMKTRGRKRGSKMIECPECLDRIVATPGEKKTCTNCSHEIGKIAVKRLIREAMKGNK